MINWAFPNHDYLQMSVVWSPANQVFQYLARRLPEIESASWGVREGVFSADDAFVGVPTVGAAHKKRVVTFSSQPELLTFFTANLQDGWNSLAYGMTEELGANAIILRFCSDHLEYPARSFTLVVKGKPVRHVSVLLADKWQFYEQGAPLAEEDTSTYKQRIIKDRLSNQQLLKLAIDLGVPFNDATRPSGPGLLFVQS